MLIDTKQSAFDMQRIKNRRFMFSPQSGELILGKQYKGRQLFASHAEEHGRSGATAPFDSFLRGWIGTGKEYPQGVIHFAPAIDSRNVDLFNRAFDALEMFAGNGAAGSTVIRGFGESWEQPLQNIIPSLERSERMSEFEARPIELTATDTAGKVKEITAQLEQGVKDLFESERYQSYLKAMSKFHDYSLNNTLLIVMQKPDASLVAGYGKWRDEFERHVKRGEKGIKILAPAPYTVKKEIEKIDQDTGRPVMGADGKPVMEQQEVKIPAFKVVSVFDVSQTEGKEIPNIAADTLTGSVEQYEDFFKALEQTSPVPIGFEKIESGAHGYYHLEDKRIAIDEGMSELQTIKTLIHEIAHAKLHDIDLNAPEQQENRPTRRTREVEAESVAYTVCQHFGLDTSDYSFGYVAGWSSDKDIKELKASLEAIRTAASELITEINGNFTELQQQRPVMESLDAQRQQAIRNEVQSTLQMLVDADMKTQGEISQGTLDALTAQGYELNEGIVQQAAIQAPSIDGQAAPESPSALFDKPQEYEAAYRLDNGNYLYIQTMEYGYDYTLFSPEFTELDGGQLENPDLSMIAARDEILALHDIKPFKIENLSMPEFMQAQEQATEAATDTPEKIGADLFELMREHDPAFMQQYEGRREEQIAATVNSLKNSLNDTFAIEAVLVGIKEDGATEEIRNRAAALIDRIDVFEEKNNTYSIYQIKGGEATRDYRFEPLDRLRATGHSIDRANYDLVYSAPLSPLDTLERIYQRFNTDHPADFTGHSLSVSDIVVLRHGDKETAHYCDSFGFAEVPEFLQQEQTAQRWNGMDGIINDRPFMPDATPNAQANALIDYAERDGQRLGNAERDLIIRYHEALQDVPKTVALVNELCEAGFEQQNGYLNYLVKQRIDAEITAAEQERGSGQPLPPSLDPAVQPVVTILWSESDKLREGEQMPLARADALFKALDDEKRSERERPGYTGSWYDKTKFRIDFTFQGERDNYEGRQDFGDGDGSLIEHIKAYHEYYAQNESWKNTVLHNDGAEAWEKEKAEREMILNDFIPYLELHRNLYEMEQTAAQPLEMNDHLTPEQTAYFNTVLAHVDTCRDRLNQGQRDLPELPSYEEYTRLAAETESYKAHVREEIAQEAAAAGMTVEEYAANGYEPGEQPSDTPPKDIDAVVEQKLKEAGIEFTHFESAEQFDAWVKAHADTEKQQQEAPTAEAAPELSGSEDEAEKDIDEILDEYPISVEINGEWHTFPNAEAAEEALAKVDELTTLERQSVEIAKGYEGLPLSKKIEVIAQTFGCNSGTIETSPCTGKWRGTSDISIRFDNGASLFIGNHRTPQAKTVRVQNECVNSALAQYNPEIVAAAKAAATDALMKREVKDNAIAAEKGLKPYTLLNVELHDGADGSGYLGWYYVTLAVDGKICAHLETGLNYDIANGKVSETPAREHYFTAGTLKEADVDYVFNNVGFSSTADLYSLPISDAVRDRAKKALAEREKAQLAVEAPDTPQNTQPAVRYYPINEAAARRAQDANSYRDYVPGSATAEYRAAVDRAAELAQAQKGRVDPMYHDKIDSLLDTYARKLAENMNNHYVIEARVPSVLVAGGSNFPVRKKEKQNAARDRNMEEWQDIQGLLDKIRSTGMGGISADDPQAVAKLEAKLENLVQSQETMKAVNAYYRKHGTLDGCTLLPPEQLAELKADMVQSWHLDKSRPFQSYALSNNNAEIRRTRERIESLKQHEQQGYAEWEFDGGRVEANREANRLQIFFDGKPDSDTRDELKANGFRWAPSAGAWQRQLNANAYRAADHISCIQPVTGEHPTELQRKAQRADTAQEQPEQQKELAPDDYLTDEKIQTPRGTFRLTSLSVEQMKEAGYSFHHQSDDGKYYIMTSNNIAFAVAVEQPPEQAQPENYLKAAEMSTEQNYNMIDQQINNTPSVDELEEKAKRGELVSLSALAAAVKAEDGRTPKRDAPGKKPSIRAQLQASKAQAAKQPKKEQEAKRSIRQALEM